MTFSHRLVSSAFVGLAFVATASAQDGNPIIVSGGNTINVEQSGDSNNLRVDQSAATNSLVAGVPSLTGGVSQGEDFGRSLDPNQDGNFFVFGDVQTSPESNSNLLTLLGPDTKATQRGDRNSADITLDGNRSFAGLEQFGNENVAAIDVDGDNAGGIIVQNGNNNDGTVTVEGGGAFGELIQIGDSNETAFTVSGDSSANVSFTVQGSGITTNIPASVVTSSGGQVTIVQRQLGTFGQ